MTSDYDTCYKEKKENNVSRTGQLEKGQGVFYTVHGDPPS